MDNTPDYLRAPAYKALGQVFAKGEATRDDLMSILGTFPELLDGISRPILASIITVGSMESDMFLDFMKTGD